MTRAAHDADAVCGCVAEHRPPVLELELHHLLPLFLGGAKDGETVWICPTSHANVHELLRMMLRAGPLTYRQCQDVQPRPVSKYAHTLAVDGYLRWQASQQ